MRATIEWPIGKTPALLEFQDISIRFFMEIAGRILIATCHARDWMEILKRLHEDEIAGHRITAIVGIQNMYQRIFGRSLSRLTDHIRQEDETFPLRERPVILNSKVTVPPSETVGTAIDSHQGITVRSVINVPLWERAKWSGAAYLAFAAKAPPIVALLFRNREAAEKIFEKWRKRFGSADEDEAIYLAVIKGSSSANPAHYIMLITSEPSEESRQTANKPNVLVGRHLEITPDTTNSLDLFLKEYQRAGAYGLAPAILRRGQAEPLTGLAILKRRLVIRHYNDIGPNDLEAMAFPQLVDRRI